MDLGIAGKWALVCGASKGLGFACAQALVREGVNVVINARHEDALEQAASALMADGLAWSSNNNKSYEKPQVVVAIGDIATVEGREAALSAPQGPGRDLDMVVTNAGGPPPGDFRDWDRITWMQALDANMLAPIELIKATVDGMAMRGFGRVVNITSSAVKAPIDILGLSNGARSGLTGFVAGLARSSLASQGVTLNNLLPGRFETDRLAATLDAAATKAGMSRQVIRDQQLARIPARRFGTPQEFGAMCAFLCSLQAGYLTGQNVLADGGAYPGTL